MKGGKRMATETQRKPVGKYGNMVTLCIRVNAAQDRQLDEYCILTEKSKAAAIRELLTLGLNELHRDGVIQ